MGGADLEYLLLRLIRRYGFTAGRLERFGRFVPYYRVNQGCLDPWPIARICFAGLAALDASVAGRSVLELGSGATNSLGYALAASGAASVVCLEPFAGFDATRDAAIRAGITASHPGADLSRVERRTDLDSLPDASISVVLSHSVLEHIPAPDGLFKSLARVLSPDGVMVHRVDYRDHFFKYPFQFLTFSEPVWRRFLDPGDLPRLRLDDHLAALARAGFTTTVVDVERNPEALARVAPRLHPDYRDRDPAMLSVTRATLCCRKR